MSLANYYKIRKNLECNNDKRKFDFMNSGGLWSQHLERIDQLETALKLSWENYNNENELQTLNNNKELFFQIFIGILWQDFQV